MRLSAAKRAVGGLPLIRANWSRMQRARGPPAARAMASQGEGGHKELRRRRGRKASPLVPFALRAPLAPPARPPPRPPAPHGRRRARRHNHDAAGRVRAAPAGPRRARPRRRPGGRRGGARTAAGFGGANQRGARLWAARPRTPHTRPNAAPPPPPAAPSPAPGRCRSTRSPPPRRTASARPAPIRWCSSESRRWPGRGSRHRTAAPRECPTGAPAGALAAGCARQRLPPLPPLLATQPLPRAPLTPPRPKVRRR
jgi:hypothetical protein